ncbi:hypothetical protein [Mucilaginibacter jinjuensis]|uniref:Uncharacterized protein n=1 Tax=Mucilaginibacter jinjuensis TaxID=1176721 RepID=A0ABY7T5K6_9SPHI|nr:hypothetical protein [Mucilaginibacter jinjuensis]WCT11744.1 hypothetical protein PQO05_23725 [Mucilaginibacter jinjuensis]
MPHTFHIPVLGLGFSIDTPLKVARYGISSVASIVDDELIERMRQYHTSQNNMEYLPINSHEPDSRARRISAYLNLMHDLVNQQFDKLKNQPFEPGNDITRYFDLLPDTSALKQDYLRMMACANLHEQEMMKYHLRWRMQQGATDVNIMAKVDKLNYNSDDEFLGDENTDALAALRGFAMSKLQSSVIMSAGMNPKLYSYIEHFDDFFPDATGRLRKKVILKVSDFRSALIQAKFLAKKGIWVSEFRIESGLNCGGHAFATDGLLLGPILEEFKQKRQEMLAELWAICQPVLEHKSYFAQTIPNQRISVQGGIGTGNENSFLLNYYQLDATGWGSPFLLVPEATNVDDDTLTNLTTANTDDFYLSASSPLGVLFNNFKKSSIEQQRLNRIEHNRPGSPCTKKFLCNNTEFTEMAICTASRQYQHLKIQELEAQQLPAADYQQQYDAITEKICLCEGLCASAYIKNDMLKPRENNAVAICPGPNLAYFKSTYSLDQMAKHIYGGINLLQNVSRPNLFINELNLYIDYLKKDIAMHLKTLTDKKEKYFSKFKEQLQQGIDYYKQLIPQITNETQESIQDMYRLLSLSEAELNLILVVKE